MGKLTISALIGFGVVILGTMILRPVCESSVNVETIRSITPGMPIEKVFRILGDPQSAKLEGGYATDQDGNISTDYRHVTLAYCGGGFSREILRLGTPALWVHIQNGVVSSVYAKVYYSWLYYFWLPKFVWRLAGLDAPTDDEPGVYNYSSTDRWEGPLFSQYFKAGPPSTNSEHLSRPLE